MTLVDLSMKYNKTLDDIDQRIEKDIKSLNRELLIEIMQKIISNPPQFLKSNPAEFKNLEDTYKKLINLPK